MKNKSTAFTLVELIVVITILAILGTIAFISLQGYSQTAKNAKISQELNTLASIVEIALTEGNVVDFNLLIEGDRSGINGVSPSSSVTLYNEDNSTETGALDNISTKYLVGNFNFSVLRQNGEDFKDHNDNKYIAAIAYSGSTAYYQLAGQTQEKSGEYIAVVKGNYIPRSGDTLSLVSANGSLSAVKNGDSLGTDTDNTNFY